MPDDADLYRLIRLDDTAVWAYWVAIFGVWGICLRQQAMRSPTEISHCHIYLTLIYCKKSAIV